MRALQKIDKDGIPILTDSVNVSDPRPRAPQSFPRKLESQLWRALGFKPKGKAPELEREQADSSRPDANTKKENTKKPTRETSQAAEP